MKPCKCAAVELPYVVGMFGVERGARRALGVPALWVNGKEIADGDGAGTRQGSDRDPDGAFDVPMSLDERVDEWMSLDERR